MIITVILLTLEKKIITNNKQIKQFKSLGIAV